MLSFNELSVFQIKFEKTKLKIQLHSSEKQKERILIEHAIIRIYSKYLQENISREFLNWVILELVR